MPLDDLRDSLVRFEQEGYAVDGRLAFQDSGFEGGLVLGCGLDMCICSNSSRLSAKARALSTACFCSRPLLPTTNIFVHCGKGGSIFCGAASRYVVVTQALLDFLLSAGKLMCFARGIKFGQDMAKGKLF